MIKKNKGIDRTEKINKRNMTDIEPINTLREALIISVAVFSTNGARIDTRPVFCKEK